MGVEPIVGTVGTLSLLRCFNTTLNHWLCELDELSGCLFLLYKTLERSLMLDVSCTFPEAPIRESMMIFNLIELFSRVELCFVFYNILK